MNPKAAPQGAAFLKKGRLLWKRKKDEIVLNDNINIEETVPNPSTLVSLEYKSFLPHILLYISIVFGILNIKIKP